MASSPFLFAQIAKSYWEAWKEFEVHHGNVDTFREMLRIKRSVQAQFNTQVNFMSAQMLAAASGLSADTTRSGQSPTLPTCIAHTRDICRWLYPLQYSHIYLWDFVFVNFVNETEFASKHRNVNI